MEFHRAIHRARAHFLVAFIRHRDRLVDLQRLLRVTAPGLHIAGPQAQLTVVAALGREIESLLHRLLRAVPVLHQDLRVRLFDHACDARHSVLHRGEVVVEAVHGVLVFPELRAAACEQQVVVADRLLAQHEFRQEFFRARVVAAVVGFLAEPADHVARCRGLAAVLLVKFDLLLGRLHVLEIVEARHQRERAALEELLLVELACLVEVRCSLLVILLLELRAPDPVVRLRPRGGLRKFLQQHLERLGHVGLIAELPVDQREILQGKFALLGLRVPGHERREILLCRRILPELHLGRAALGEHRGHLCVRGKFAQESGERLDRLVVMPELHPAPAELERRLALVIFRQRLRLRDDDLVNGRGVLEVARLEQRLRLHQRDAVHLGRDRVFGEVGVCLVQQPRVASVVEHHESRVAGLARLRGRGKFARDLRVHRQRLVALPQFALRIRHRHEHVQLALHLQSAARADALVPRNHALVVFFFVEDAEARDGDHVLPRGDVRQCERCVESLRRLVGAPEFHLQKSRAGERLRLDLPARRLRREGQQPLQRVFAQPRVRVHPPRGEPARIAKWVVRHNLREILVLLACLRLLRSRLHAAPDKKARGVNQHRLREAHRRAAVGLERLAVIFLLVLHRAEPVRRVAEEFAAGEIREQRLVVGLRVIRRAGQPVAFAETVIHGLPVQRRGPLKLIEIPLVLRRRVAIHFLRVKAVRVLELHLVGRRRRTAAHDDVAGFREFRGGLARRLRHRLRRARRGHRRQMRHGGLFGAGDRRRLPHGHSLRDFRLGGFGLRCSGAERLQRDRLWRLLRRRGTGSEGLQHFVLRMGRGRERSQHRHRQRQWDATSHGSEADFGLFTGSATFQIPAPLQMPRMRAMNL